MPKNHLPHQGAISTLDEVFLRNHASLSRNRTTRKPKNVIDWINFQARPSAKPWSYESARPWVKWQKEPATSIIHCSALIGHSGSRENHLCWKWIWGLERNRHLLKIQILHLHHSPFWPPFTTSSLVMIALLAAPFVFSLLGKIAVESGVLPVIAVRLPRVVRLQRCLDRGKWIARTHIPRYISWLS